MSKLKKKKNLQNIYNYDIFIIAEALKYCWI